MHLLHLAYKSLYILFVSLHIVNMIVYVCVHCDTWERQPRIEAVNPHSSCHRSIDPLRIHSTVIVEGTVIFGKKYLPGSICNFFEDQKLPISILWHRKEVLPLHWKRDYVRIRFGGKNTLNWIFVLWHAYHGMLTRAYLIASREKPQLMLRKCHPGMPSDTFYLFKLTLNDYLTTWFIG